MSRSIPEMVNEVAKYKANRSFTDEFKKDENLESRKEEGLGIAIAEWTEWDGLKIMRVFSAALKDANFHEEAASVAEMIERTEKKFDENSKEENQ